MGVVPQRLFWWRRRLRRAALTSPMFVPVVATAASARSTAALAITTASGARIEVYEVDAATAAWVASVLGERTAT